MIDLAAPPGRGPVAGVAGVLAHEIAHGERRHSLKALAKSLGIAATRSLILGDMGGLASLGGDLIRLKFSRNHQADADREGIELLIAARIHPQGINDFLRKMAKQGPSVPGFLSPHPASEERMVAIDALVKALPAEALAPLQDGFTEMKKALPAPKP